MAANARRSPLGRPYCENAEYVGFVRRILRALARRGRADLDVLPMIAAVQADLDLVVIDILVGALADGRSWQDAADRLGVTRQAVHLRYAARVAARQAELDIERAGLAAARAAAEAAVSSAMLPPLVPLELDTSLAS